MNLISFIRLLAKHLKTMLLAGILLAVMVWYGTRNETKEYTSHTLINTGLVSGYNLESSEGAKVDYAYTNNEIENLLSLASSYEMMEELAMNLLAEYIIMDEPNPDLITLEGWERMKENEVHDVRLMVKVAGDKEKTLENIRKYRAERSENAVQLLLYGKHPFFGIEHLKELQAMREGKSDQLRFRYSTTDPAVCRYTLEKLTEIFIDKHRRIKQIQSTDVLEFFENATKEAQENLDTREDRLLSFMIQNKIINYYEQTRYIAAAKEDLDEMYFHELMTLAGADSTLKRLELEMEKHSSLPELNTGLILKRDKLAKLSARIAEFELFRLDSFPADQSALQELKLQSNILQEEIHHAAGASFAVNRTPEGVELKNLLTQWLNKVMDVEQSMARLGVFKKRKVEFEEIYSKFAPWGSRIKRYEREIDVAERAYLENLHSYNQARLHKFNMMMSANLKVIDQPFLPIKPAESKRKMLVVVGFLAGFILVLAVALALELMDSSLKTPIRATEQTGLEIAGAFPLFPAIPQKKQVIDFSKVRERSVGQLLQQIKLHLRGLEKPNGGPHRIAIISTRQGEGKSFVTQMAVEKLRATGERVAYIFPGAPLPDGHPDDFCYQPDIHFFEKKSEEKLVNQAGFADKDYQYIFLELPALLTDTYPVDLLAQYDLSLVVARSNRSWSHADAKAMDNFKKGISALPKLVVNGLHPEALEDSLGEIPKRRSRVRQMVKGMVLYLQPSA